MFSSTAVAPFGEAHAQAGTTDLHFTGMNQDTVTGAYVYDALFASRMILRDGNGMRVKKCLPNCSNPTTTTVYIYAGHQVIAAYDNGAAVGSPSREYILAGGTRLAKISAGSTVYYHRDQVSTRVTTDANGNIVSQQGHYPFGENWYQTGSATTDQQFTTYQRDTESGNDYALAREFVNRLGRFSSLDPMAGDIGNPQSLNRYAYAANDPIDLLDPEGEYICVTGCGGNLAMGIGGWDDFGSLYLMTATVPNPGYAYAQEQGDVGNTPRTIPVDIEGPVELLEPPDIGPPDFPGLGPGLTATNTSPPSPLVLCAKAEFDVTMTSFSASVPGQAGTFTGVTGILAPGGPSLVTITNNVSFNAAQTNANYIALGGSIPPGITIPSYTNLRSPYTNFTSSQQPPGLVPPPNAYGMEDQQIWELGNSLGAITNQPRPAVPNFTPTPANNEFGHTLLNCVLGQESRP